MTTAIDWIDPERPLTDKFGAGTDLPLLAGLKLRTFDGGETAFCYANDAQPLLAALAHALGLRYLHCPANLEDLLIKLTGRELRD